MSCVLVTGASGLIGRHSVAALVAGGHRVHAVARRVPECSPPGVTWHGCDLLDEKATERMVDEVAASHLLHLAWITDHGAFWQSPKNLDWLAASKHLIEAFQRVGGKRLTVAGSCAEYDWSDLADGVCREDRTPLKPHTAYGRHKLELARWLDDFADETGLSAAWGRVFLLYGAGEPVERLVPSIVLALDAGHPANCSSGRHVRDFMAARDVGWAFAALVMSAVTGALNIATGEPHTIGEVAQVLGAYAGRPDLIRLGALPDRVDDPAVLVGDITRLRDEVGFQPRTGFLNGLKEAYDEIRKGNG